MKIFDLFFNVFWVVFAVVLFIKWLLGERELQRLERENRRRMEEIFRRCETDGEQRGKKDASKGDER